MDNIQTDLHSILREFWKNTPQAHLADSQELSTFLLCEVTQLSGDNIRLSLAVIDKEFENFKHIDANDYIACKPRIRIALELSQILPIVAPAISGVAIHAPFDEEIKGSKTERATILRRMTLKAAVLALANYGREHHPD